MHGGVLESLTSWLRTRNETEIRQTFFFVKITEIVNNLYFVEAKPNSAICSSVKDPRHLFYLLSIWMQLGMQDLCVYNIKLTFILPQLVDDNEPNSYNIAGASLIR